MSAVANSGGGVVVTSGRNAKMPCRVDGQPKPKVYWISPKKEKFFVGTTKKGEKGHIRQGLNILKQNFDV